MIIEEENNAINNEDLIKLIQERETNTEYSIKDEKMIQYILSFLHNKENKNAEKQIIVKYLTNCFTNVPLTSDILLNKTVDKKYLYNILIYEYIINFEDKEYKEELRKCFEELIKNKSFDKSIYQYIISFISNYINKKSILSDENKEKLTQEFFNEEIDVNDFNVNYMQSILELLNIFYEMGAQTKNPTNYYYFSGKENQGIKIENKDNKINFESSDVYILLYIKLYDKKFLGKFDKFQLLNLKLTGDKNITLHITPNNEKSTDTDALLQYDSFQPNEINKVFIKINQNSKIEIKVNETPIEFSNILYSDTKIESLEFFNNFIGICSNIIIYKDNSDEKDIPKILKKDFFKYGIHKEEIFSQFTKAHIKNEIEDKNMTDLNLIKSRGADLDDIKAFFENNLLSIYIPTRYEKTDDEKNIILCDAINGLNGLLKCENALTGLHTLDHTIKSFYSIGSINHLLPIIELMIQENSFLNETTFNLYMNIIATIFSKLSYLFQLFDKNSKFFFHFSHFLEKTPQNLFSKQLCEKLKELTIIFSTNKDDMNYIEVNEQFIEYIILNTKILLKFSFEEQKEIINQIIKYINLKSKYKIFININIIRIINILLHYDHQRYNKYCCKIHKDYFINAKDEDVMNPELNVVAEPVFDLIKELLNRTLSQFNLVSDTNLINDYNLDKLFDLLTYDISPCLQKKILTLFYDLRKSPKQLLFKLNKDRKMMYVLLFLIQTSVFEEIRDLAYDFALLLSDEKFSNEEKDKSITNANKKIRQFIEYHILPYYLLVDEKEKDANINSNIDYNKFIKDFDIDKKIKYNYLLLSPQQIKLKHNYNYDKLNDYMNRLFEKIYQSYSKQKENIELNMNILVKIAAKADISLNIKFLDNLKNELKLKEEEEFIKLKEIYLNKKLLHYLLELSFHSYLLKNMMEKGEKDEYNLGIIFPKDMSDEDKKKSVADAFEKSNSIVVAIFSRSVYKLDYLLTWAKYYFEINKEESIFYSIRAFIQEHIFEKVFPSVSEITIPNIMAKPEQRKILYFYNIVFEYYSYFRIIPFYNNNKKSDLDRIEAVYEEISILFRHNIINDLKKEYKEKYSEENIVELPFYKFLKKIMSYFQKIWSENKIVTKDKDFYFSYLYHKENVYINDLELLFFTFDNTKILQTDSSTNRGVPLLIILFHHFTLFLSIVTEKKEFKELIKNFRLLISLVIISSCTLMIAKGKGNVPGPNSTIKPEEYKTMWPNEDEYNEVQKQVKLFMFNCFYFLYFRIIEVEELIKKNQNNKDKLDNLNTIKTYMYDTLAYFLRLLNGLLKDRKKHEDNKNKKTIKSFFRTIKHKIITTLDGINVTGPFMFIMEFFDKCFIRYSSNNNNNLDVLSFIINKNTFMDEIQPFNILAFNDETSENYKKIYTNIETGVKAFLADANIKSYLNDNFFEKQRALFPFIRYIINRRTVALELLPIYNNSFYCKYKYNDICLIPNYFPFYKYYNDISNHIEKANKTLTDEIRIIEIKTNIEDYDRISKYYKIKKKLFTFLGIWSKEQFFYDSKKYGLKYKIFNHLTDDYTKIFLTPIIDMDYYLPKFLSFNKDELFRKDDDKITIPKIADLSSDLFNIENIVNQNVLETKHDKELYEDKVEEEKVDNKKKEEVKEEIIKEENKIIEEKIDEEIIDEEKKDNEIKEDDKKEDVNKKNENKEVIEEDKKEEELNNLYLLKKIGYKFTDNVDVVVRDPKKYFKLFKFYVTKINSLNPNTNTFLDLCCLVKSSYHIRGLFYNNTKEIGFYGFDHIPFIAKLEYDNEKKKCFGSTFKKQLKKYNGYHITIPYNQIAYVIKRRYLFKEVAIEVFTTKNKSYLFKLHDKSIKEIYKNLKEHMKSTLEDIITDNRIIGFVNFNKTNNPFINTNILKYKGKEMCLKKLYEKWTNWEISTLKFLMLLNMYSSRSLNDIYQYPVFPWIITNYTEKNYKLLQEDKNLIRPFEVPMGMMELTASSQIRKKSFIEEWDAEKESQEKENQENQEQKKKVYISRYKTHYSNPYYVTYYLIRNFPFSNIRIELQDSKWDNPNKQFVDLENSFNLASIQKNDLRELIPEMFCLPEMFINKNNLNLGEITEIPEGENGENNEENNQIMNPKLVNNVKLPEWANNNPYNFIKKHREFLESPEINQKINEWFNLIFGSKQKGEEAEKIHNLFPEESYDDFERTYMETKEDDIKIEYNKKIDLGLTPSQIMKEDSLKRKLTSELKTVRPLLYNVTKAFDKGEDTSKLLELSEIDIPYVDEVPYKIFDSIKQGYLKWRIYILGKKNLRIFKKIEQKVEKSITTSTPSTTTKTINTGDNNEKKENIINENQEKDEKVENVEKKEEEKEEKEEKKAENIETKQNLKKINIAKKYIIKLPEYKFRIETDNNYYKCSAIFGKGQYMALGGYFNGDIIVKTLDYNAKPKDISKTLHLYSTTESSPITSIVIDETETYAICGNKLGTVFIFVISQQQKWIWKISKILNNHKSEISSIAVSANLNIFSSCSKDGYCMLYSLPRIKLFNSFKIEPQKTEDEEIENKIIYPDITLIYDAPLPCFIFYIKSLKQLYVYSINGQFLTKNKLEYDIINNGIAKYIDNQCRDYLFIYNSLDKTIDVHRAIDFELVVKSPTIKYKFIDFVLGKDLDQALILTENENYEKEKADANIDIKKPVFVAKYKLLVFKDKENELRWK